MTGARIGDYVIERELGSGGMGSVYLGRSRSGRAVAIKVIRAEYAADPRFRDRFRKEVEAARRVGGFHTAAVVDADPDAPQPWMASAYIKGPTLAEEVARRGPLSEARLWALTAALAEALAAIHSCGLVHRDLKPGNIVLAEDGPRVLDFGIARAAEGTRLTGDGVTVGTPGFLAPEQALGHPVTGACDVFALGAVVVAAAGGSAFGDGAPYGLMYRAVHEEADVSAVPAALRGLALACLHKEAGRRPTPRELLDLCDDRTGPTADRTATVADHSGSGLHSADTETPSRSGSPPPPPPPRRSTPPPRPAAAPRAASAAAPAAQLALYRRSRRGWAGLVLRNTLFTFGLIGAVLLSGPLLHQPALTAVLSFIAFMMTVRLFGLLGSAKDGLVLGGPGIGVGPPDNLVVLHWSDITSLELESDGKQTDLVLRLAGGQRLPVGFQHPTWVRTSRNGPTRIHTRGLAPTGDAGPLADTVRALAAQHGIPLGESGSG
ncbi:serine/threonine-protein kinase [Streptomyces sp. NK08204]|uniref:serine/threonine-protein kinase n=1 Tax=Streptomyces sp. NK08204 TaxID=2873260 RepID=UPI001CEDB936|nr:serine/threonine-protein kinase [Streptomyces sp. NK08204]